MLLWLVQHRSSGAPLGLFLSLDDAAKWTNEKPVARKLIRPAIDVVVVEKREE